MCDGSNCQLLSSEILGLPCLRLPSVSDTAADVSESRNKGLLFTIGDFVSAVKAASKEKTAVRDAYGRECYDGLKRSLPVWINGGIGGTKAETITPNGLVTIDIDHTDGHELEIKAKLAELPFIAISCVSISGHGVYALAYAPDHAGNAERIRSEIYAVIAHYLSAVLDVTISDGTGDKSGARIDPACTDVSRKRFETYDPDIYIAEKVKAFEPIDTLIVKKWNTSKIKRLAEKMGYTDVSPNHASVGAILALTAASAKLTLWDKDIITPHETYQARAGVIILGDSGEGKKRIDSAVQIVANRLGCQCGNSKSTADMAYRASLSCNTVETDDKKKSEWKPKAVRDVHPFIEINDEVYATISTNRAAQYAMDKAAQRRLLLDTHYNAQTTRKDSLPDYGFTPCYQYLCYSQYDSYAEAMAGERTDTGDGRRELVCELPKIETDGQPLEVSMFRARISSPASDLDSVYTALKSAYDQNRDRINANFGHSLEGLSVSEIEGESKKTDFPALDYESRPRCQFTFFRCLEGLSDTNKRDAFTHFANIATLSAYIEGRNAITTSDILTAAAIARASMALRDKIQDRCDEIGTGGCDRQIAWLTKYWEKPGKSVSQAGYSKAKVNNGIGISAATRESVETWERANLIDYYSGTNKCLRRGTQAELDALAADMETANALSAKAGAALNRLTLKWNTANGETFTVNGRPVFSQDAPDAQRIRVCEMVTKCLNNGKCGQFVKGERQTCLFRLRNVMTTQGMWGSIAKEILAGLARDAGLPEWEITRTLEK